MRSALRVLLFALPILFLASVYPVPAQSGPTGVRSAIALNGSPPPSLLPFTSPFTYYLPFIGTRYVSIYRTTVSQGSSLENYGFAIQGRAAVVRAFVSVSDGTTVSGVNARLFVMNGSTTVGYIDSNTITAPSVISNMNRTLNFDVPGSWIQPGNSYYIQLDPSDPAPGTLNPYRRYPQSGTIALNASYARPLQVVLIPVNYLPYGSASSYNPSTNYASYLEWMPDKVFPVPNVTYITSHDGIFYTPSGYSENLDDLSGAGWNKLLQQLTQVHNDDLSNPTWSSIAYNSVYYGVVNIAGAHNGCANCITGVAWIGDHAVLPTAVGWSGNPNGSNTASETMTHEIGHNFGREHALCNGNESYPDPYYPYPGGKIGVWGLDTATHTLYDPTTVADYMSYCSTVWTSDYTFAGIKAYREAGPFTPVRVASSLSDALYVSGVISASDQVTFRPVYRASGSVSNLDAGTHVLEIVGASGAVLASYPFTPARIADSNGVSGFGFFVPALDEAAGLRVRKDGKLLGEKAVAALPAAANFRALAPSARRELGGTVLRWAAVTHPTEPVAYSVRISRDGGATWEVLALDLASPELRVPTSVDVSNSLVEIQASDGIHVVAQTINVGQIP